MHAQELPDLKFSLLSTANGLPTNLINTIVKDGRGLMWFGSADKGLLRFDGKKVKVYNSHYLNNPGITSDYISYICEDHQGWLWVSSLSGLYHFDPITEKTIAYTHDEKNKYSLNSNVKPYPFIDSKGHLWISTSKGLQQFDAVKNQFISYTIPPVQKPAWKPIENEVGKILEDKNHRLWVSGPFGLYLADPVKHELIPYYSGIYSWITDIFQDENNQIWVSFWGAGLKTFQPETGTYSDQLNSFKVILKIGNWETKKKQKLICFTDGTAFIFFDRNNRQWRTFSEENINPTSIKGFNINFFYKDEENRLWICSNAGINIVDMDQQDFHNHLLQFENIKSQTKGIPHPKAICALPNSYLVSNWLDGKIYEYDKSWELKKKGKNIQPGNAPPFPIHFIKVIDGATWYGTDNGIIKETNLQLIRFVPNDKFAAMDWKYAARNILKREDGLYWVRFRDRGIYTFNPVSGNFGRSHREQFKGSVWCMEYDRNNTLWLGTESGMYRYQETSDSFTSVPILILKNGKKSEISQIQHFVFDKANIAWLATDVGLIKFDPAKHKATYISDDLRTDEMTLMKIAEDNNGILWMESLKEIIAYKKTENRFYYFSAQDGLPSSFNCDMDFFTMIDDSTIAVGNPRLITTFNTNRLIPEERKSRILFTDIVINNQRISLQTDVEGNQSITVQPGDKNINIHFTLLNYAKMFQQKLFYRLSSSKNEDWIETKEGDINLFNLPSGKYVLEIKGGYASNRGNNSINKIMLIIKPYWYRTFLFGFFSTLLLLGLLILFILRRFKQIKKEAAIKQQITETEMAALKAQMNPHFMFNCINSIDAFIQTNDKYQATLYLNKFAKLLRNILESSKQNTVQLSKDIDTLKLYVELEELRHENKFKTTFQIEEDLLYHDYKVPPLIIQPFVENAILHGLKNREDNAGILEIGIKKVGDIIEYTIKDNGIGRKAAGLMAQNKESSYGMQMSYDRIKLFNQEKNASVTIKDLMQEELPAGTAITVHLKIK